MWVDLEGKEEPLAVRPNAYRWPRVSPEGNRVVIAVEDSDFVLDPGTSDVWTYDLVRGVLTQLTFDTAFDGRPMWTPDGRRVVFLSRREGGANNLFWRAADGTGSVERLTTSPNTDFHFPYSFSLDGKNLLFQHATPRETGSYEADIYMLSMEDRKIQPLVADASQQQHAAVSPDGRWVAYTSRESGQNEIYVRPFPNVDDGKVQISTEGGRDPVWNPQGRELFYMLNTARPFYGGNETAMLRVRYETEPTFTPGSPEVLFTRISHGGGGRQFDIHPDGKRFLMIKEGGPTGQAQQELAIVLNWFDELKRLVPTE